MKWRNDPKHGKVRLVKGGTKEDGTDDDRKQWQACRFFTKKGGCSKGFKCNFSHSATGASQRGQKSGSAIYS